MMKKTMTLYMEIQCKENQKTPMKVMVLLKIWESIEKSKRDLSIKKMEATMVKMVILTRKKVQQIKQVRIKASKYLVTK